MTCTPTAEDDDEKMAKQFQNGQIMSPCAANLTDDQDMDFMSRATKRALEAAWGCSPVKPMAKKEKQQKLATFNKKPAAAPRAVLKRPAASQPETQKKPKPAANGTEPREWFQDPDRLGLVKKAGAKVSIKSTDKRSTYTSRAYNLGKHMAKEESGSSTEMRPWAKVALSGASETWDQHAR